MTRAERIARGLVEKYGASEGYWLAMQRVRGWIVDATDPARVTFWRSVRTLCYDRIGKPEVWA